MYIIFVYDVNHKRVNKVLKIARKYLVWVQNSVLEGELTRAQLHKLQTELLNIIKVEEDSCVFYTFRSKRYSQRESMGKEKRGENNFFN